MEESREQKVKRIEATIAELTSEKQDREKEQEARKSIPEATRSTEMAADGKRTVDQVQSEKIAELETRIEALRSELAALPQPAPAAIPVEKKPGFFASLLGSKKTETTEAATVVPRSVIAPPAAAKIISPVIMTICDPTNTTQPVSKESLDKILPALQDNKKFTSETKNNVFLLTTPGETIIEFHRQTAGAINGPHIILRAGSDTEDVETEVMNALQWICAGVQFNLETLEFRPSDLVSPALKSGFIALFEKIRKNLKIQRELRDSLAAANAAKASVEIPPAAPAATPAQQQPAATSTSTSPLADPDDATTERGIGVVATPTSETRPAAAPTDPNNKKTPSDAKVFPPLNIDVIAKLIDDKLGRKNYRLAPDRKSLVRSFDNRVLTIDEYGGIKGQLITGGTKDKVNSTLANDVIAMLRLYAVLYHYQQGKDALLPPGVINIIVTDQGLLPEQMRAHASVPTEVKAIVDAEVNRDPKLFPPEFLKGFKFNGAPFKPDPAPIAAPTTTPPTTPKMSRSSD